MGERLIIGSRASRLALAQTEWVAERLRAAWPDLEITVEKIRTTGDRATPLGRSSGAGFFVKELEHPLLNGRIDLAVHSMKDVPTRRPEGLEVEAVVPRRADARDCLVTAAGHTLDQLPEGATVGTSSPRRRAMLLAARSDLRFMDLRGNIETRLAKLASGACCAAVLARAGLERLGILDERAAPLDTAAILPAAGQGALGLEFRADDKGVRRLVAPLDHPPSRWAVVAERALVRRLGAGCRTPLGALGRIDEAGELVLEVRLLSPNGGEGLARRTSGPAEAAGRIGSGLAEQLLEDGARGLLARTHGEADA